MSAVYVYIVECADGTYYTGWTTDPVRRLKMHNAGRGSRYTRRRRPVRLAYCEEQPDRASAQRRELVLKRLSRGRKQALVDGFDRTLSDGHLVVAGMPPVQVAPEQAFSGGQHESEHENDGGGQDHRCP